MKNPTWNYRLSNGEIEAKVFHGMVEGWEDHPDKCTAEAPKKRGRPKKVKDGDGA